MRIKRFIAPDMRTALRMVREEQGPDAVILSNRPAEGGIEVVAATDYDEALVQQALRSAAPGLDLAAAPKLAAVAAPMAQTSTQHVATTARREPGRAEAMIAALTRAPQAAPEPAKPIAAPAARVAATVAEPAPHDATPQDGHAAGAPAHVPTPFVGAAAPAPGDDFRAVLARLIPDPVPGAAPVASRRVHVVVGDEEENAPTTAAPAPAVVEPVAAVAPEIVQPASAAGITAPTADSHDTPTTDIATTTASSSNTTQPADVTKPGPGAGTAPAPALQLVPAEDPALHALRAELAAMRALMERQLGELAIERLRGSPARAAVFDALRGYGCDEALAQAVATRIDPRMPVEPARTAMLDELARMLTVQRAEPLDDGGVIALVGPTGAGKTTTAARLAARFAERHRARDVALVTTDTERAGAREQLHAHGRRLGITVCEAEGPEALDRTLAQLADYPLVLVDTAGYAARDRALLGQILWLRTARRVRSLLVLPANANPHDLAEVARRYRPATPEGVVLTKVDETGHLGAALSVLVKHNLALAYASDGQQLADIAPADPDRLVRALEALHRAAANPLATEDRHAVA